MSAICLHTQAQNFNFSGKITNKSGLPLEMVNVALSGSTYGTITNKNGEFNISVPKSDSLVFHFSLLGYAPKYVKVNTYNTNYIEATLEISDFEINEIRIRYEKERHLPVTNLSPKVAGTLPGAISGGIEGLIKTLPGVSSAGELSSQYSVRGGNFDENLVYIHGIEIPKSILIRSGQQEGLSIINPDLTGVVSFSAGGFDASLGDKISSALSIEYKKPHTFAAHAYAGLLGAGASVLTPFSKSGYILSGVRYKQSKYVLGTLETQGEYQPNFLDAQVFIHKNFLQKHSLSAFLYAAQNRYIFIPTNRQTEFGTATTPLKLSTYFDGKESDLYQTTLSALVYNYTPSVGNYFSWNTSFYTSVEKETWDILAQYWLNELNKQLDSPEYGDSLLNIGIGSSLDHARNYLHHSRFQSNVSYRHETSTQKVSVGIHFNAHNFVSELSQWTMLDSTGYSLPYNSNNFSFWYSFSDSPKIAYTKTTAWAIHQAQLISEHGKFIFNSGMRVNYFGLNQKFYFSPRLNIAFQPFGGADILYRVSGGNYLQFPEFKEFQGLNENEYPEITIQNSWQAMAGLDYNFSIWNRPFKATAEIYYKHLSSTIPYLADNVKIYYFPKYIATGYTTGLDVKINGEFVPDAESWLGFSLMRSREKLETTDSQWRNRPNDQLFMVNIFFQDYFPRNDKLRFFVNMTYASGIPISAPNEILLGPVFRTIPYRRVDLGINAHLTFLEKKINLLSNTKQSNVFIWFEVLNMLDILNTASYQWIRIIPNQIANGVENNTMQFAIPNRLTGRLFNVRLQISI